MSFLDQFKPLFYARLKRIFLSRELMIEAIRLTDAINNQEKQDLLQGEAKDLALTAYSYKWDKRSNISKLSDGHSLRAFLCPIPESETSAQTQLGFLKAASFLAADQVVVDDWHDISKYALINVSPCLDVTSFSKLDDELSTIVSVGSTLYNPQNRELLKWVHTQNLSWDEATHYVAAYQQLRETYNCETAAWICQLSYNIIHDRGLHDENDRDRREITDAFLSPENVELMTWMKERDDERDESLSLRDVVRHFRDYEWLCDWGYSCGTAAWICQFSCETRGNFDDVLFDPDEYTILLNWIHARDLSWDEAVQYVEIYQQLRKTYNCEKAAWICQQLYETYDCETAAWISQACYDHGYNGKIEQLVDAESFADILKVICLNAGDTEDAAQQYVAKYSRYLADNGHEDAYQIFSLNRLYGRLSNCENPNRYVEEFLGFIDSGQYGEDEAHQMVLANIFDDNHYDESQKNYYLSLYQQARRKRQNTYQALDCIAKHKLPIVEAFKITYVDVLKKTLLNPERMEEALKDAGQIPEELRAGMDQSQDGLLESVITKMQTKAGVQEINPDAQLGLNIVEEYQRNGQDSLLVDYLKRSDLTEAQAYLLQSAVFRAGSLATDFQDQSALQNLDELQIKAVSAEKRKLYTFSVKEQIFKEIVEFSRIFNDPALRAFIYRNDFSWDEAVKYIELYQQYTSDGFTSDQAVQFIDKVQGLVDEQDCDFELAKASVFLSLGHFLQKADQSEVSSQDESAVFKSIIARIAEQVKATATGFDQDDVGEEALDASLAFRESIIAIALKFFQGVTSNEVALTNRLRGGDLIPSERGDDHFASSIAFLSDEQNLKTLAEKDWDYFVTCIEKVSQSAFCSEKRALELWVTLQRCFVDEASILAENQQIKDHYQKLAEKANLGSVSALESEAILGSVVCDVDRALKSDNVPQALNELSQSNKGLNKLNLLKQDPQSYQLVAALIVTLVVTFVLAVTMMASVPLACLAASGLTGLMLKSAYDHYQQDQLSQRYEKTKSSFEKIISNDFQQEAEKVRKNNLENVAAEVERFIH